MKSACKALLTALLLLNNEVHAEFRSVTIPGSDYSMEISTDWIDTEIYLIGSSSKAAPNGLSLSLPSKIKGASRSLPDFEFQYHPNHKASEQLSSRVHRIKFHAARLDEEPVEFSAGKTSIEGHMTYFLGMESRLRYTLAGGSHIVKEVSNFELFVDTDDGLLRCSLTSNRNTHSTYRRALLRLCSEAINDGSTD